MRAAIWGLSLCALIGTAAQAADVAVSPAKQRTAPLYAGSWAGAYFGGFAGGHWSKDRWGSDETLPVQILGPIDLQVNGFTGGFISGANLQRGNFVWGVETDIGFFTGSNNFGPLRTLYPGLANIDSIETELRYNAHARLRFGYSMGSWMPFMAAGAAYANTRATLTDTTNPGGVQPVTRSITQNRIGYTVGGGVDMMFAPNWIARVEYLHDRYLTTGFGVPVRLAAQYLELNTNAVRAALLYRFDGGDAGVPGSVFKAPVAARAQTWAGVYIGAFAGGHRSTDRWTSDESTEFTGAGPLDIKVDGFNGGGLIGANVQFGSLVWGVEVDAGVFTGSKNLGSLRTLLGGGQLDSIESTMRWNAHARIRSGYSFGSWMPFLATGVAFANTRASVDDSTNVPPIPDSGSISLDRIGFSSGGGVDWMFAPNWIARAEYIFDRYAAAGHSLPTSGNADFMELRSHIVRGALMYKLGNDMPVPASGGIYKAPAASAVAGWTGVYIGAFAGGHWSRDRWTSDETQPASALGAFSLNANGGTFGGLIGANLQQGRAVWGIEADGGWMTGSGDLGPMRTLFPGPFPNTTDIDVIETKMRANAHGRLRFGYDAGAWMPFIAGGVAYANTRMAMADSTNTPPNPTSGSLSLNRVGFTIGGGVDWRFAANWIGRVEYLHDRYGTASFALPVDNDSQHMELRSNIVRGALIYKIGEPVFARN